MIKYVLLAAALMLTNCTVIGPGERGIRYNLGKMSETTLEPGTHLWIPYLAGSQTMNVQVQAIHAVVNSGTKDQQEVTTDVNVNLQVDSAHIIDIVKTVGDEDALLSRILPQIQEAINANVSKYSAEEILTKRNQLKGDIEALVKERLAKYSVIVHDISIKDLQYSEEYSQAIEAKQIAEQQAKQAAYVAQKATQQAVADVERAKGQAESQKLMKSSITPEILQKMAIEKWDGSFPQVMGTGSLPFINLNMKGAK